AEPAGPAAAVEVDAAGTPALVETVGRDDPRLGLTAPPTDRASAAAWAGFADATVLTFPEAAEAGAPVRVRVAGAGRAEAGAQHILVVAEAGARGTVILEHVGRAALTETVEIRLGPGADLTVVSLQEWEPGGVHAGSHRALVGRDAHLKHVVVTLGGDAVRIAPEVAFSGPGGDVEMLGLYLTDSGQHHEHRLFADHAQPRCRSRVAYKGALQGANAHSVWIGDVLIRAAAHGTDTYELNRNLVLARGARADSVPNLEIETGEIEGAGHASATGRFDDQQLFYLQSRGIDPATARRLVVHGFFAELIGRIGVPDLAERLIASVDARLAAAIDQADPDQRPKPVKENS
ncbi:MAG: Fe-S cluster assembly protein SufD, partial [Bifidobacteriaceae bacterium]|nr:Fe-S cluster assembly protein SufD [Bifidobacteriaceae bacterium]